MTTLAISCAATGSPSAANSWPPEITSRCTRRIAITCCWRKRSAKYHGTTTARICAPRMGESRSAGSPDICLRRSARTRRRRPPRYPKSLCPPLMLNLCLLCSQGYEMSITYDLVGVSRNVREDFPVLSTDLDGKTPTYLDNAATTHKPRQVLDAIYEFYATANSNVGRSVHTLSMRATDRYQQARERVRDFISADSPEEIVFTRGATDSLNMIAQGFAPKIVAPGDEVLISGLEHHSNLLPWRQLCERVGADLKLVPVDEHGEVSAAAFREHMTGRTRLIALAHISNVQGTVTPVAEIASDAHSRGIVVVVDGAQAVAHRAVDVCDLDADFYCFSSHKMYGPMGIGVLYGKAKYLQAMDPVHLGGGSAKHVTHDGPVRLVERPQLFEAGTPKIFRAVGAAPP